jgi:hypothetical protein
MSIDKNKLENELVVDDISEDAEELENELVEDQQVEDEEVLEAKKVKEEEDEDDDEEEVEESADEDDEEDEEPEVKEISVPKTKAGVIQAAVDMLKKARKEDAQKIFAKMAKVDEMEDNEKKSIETLTKQLNQLHRRKTNLRRKLKLSPLTLRKI